MYSVIKHKCAHQGPYNTIDKFKVEIYHGERLIGSKVVISRLKDGDDPAQVKYFYLDVHVMFRVFYCVLSQSLNESLGFTKLDTTPESLYLSNSVTSEWQC